MAISHGGGWSALEVPERNAAFSWVGDAGRAMLGLWSLGTAPLGLNPHVAFEVAMDDLLDAPQRLEAQGLTPLSFFARDDSLRAAPRAQARLESPHVAWRAKEAPQRVRGYRR